MLPKEVEKGTQHAISIIFTSHATLHLERGKFGVAKLPYWKLAASESREDLRFAHSRVFHVVDLEQIIDLLLLCASSVGHHFRQVLVLEHIKRRNRAAIEENNRLEYLSM